MNSALLLLIAAVVLVLGYRFYSKWLALWLFRLDTNYSTPAQAHADERDFVATDRHVLLGQHFAIVAGATTLTGTGLAIIWGWIPAFLWVVVGTAVAGGIYAIGTLWLGVRGDAIYAGVLGQRLYLPFFALATVLLTLTNGMLVWLAAELLAAHPAIAAPFWAQLAIALACARALRAAQGRRLLALSLALTLAGLATLWLLGKLAFAFSGALNVDLRGRLLVSVDAIVLWVVLLLVAGYHAARLPVWRWLQPQGYLTALHAGLLLLALLAGVLLTQAPVLAPTFHRPAGGPGAIPWLFVTLTSGAVAGFYLLFTLGVSARQLARETEARYVGYGAALAEGALALGALVVSAAAFANAEQWQAFYASWAAAQDPSALLALFIDGFARLTAVLPVDPGFARSFAAFVVAGLIAVTLEAGVRVQAGLFEKLGQRLLCRRLTQGRLAVSLAIALTAVLALHDAEGRGALAPWPLFGIWNQGLAVLGFTLVGLALHRQGRGRPTLYLFASAALLLVVASWALALQLPPWWAEGRWVLLAGGALLLVLEGWLIWEVVRVLRGPAVPAPEA